MHRKSKAVLLVFSLSVASSVASAQDTLGAKPPEGGHYLFAGDLSNWVGRDGKPATWPVSDGVFTVGAKSGDIMTRQKFRDYQLHVEFNVPYMPDKTGQARGNSGVYQQGIYELQVLDSHGLKSQDNDCGAIYKQIVPSVNACKPPLQWQTYDITFRAARVDKATGKITEKARISVIQNGKSIIDNKEIMLTPGGISGVEDGSDGPILLQDHGNAVQYRNIWIKPL